MSWSLSSLMELFTGGEAIAVVRSAAAIAADSKAYAIDEV
jgi:hypothetical protein